DSAVPGQQGVLADQRQDDARDAEGGPVIAAVAALEDRAARGKRRVEMGGISRIQSQVSHLPAHASRESRCNRQELPRLTAARAAPPRPLETTLGDIDDRRFA